MQNYCTLFNTNYLTRALVMYDSMVAAKSNFHLYIFAFDDTVHDFFKNKYLRNNVTVISLSELEDPELLKVKPTRSAGEYCWTSTSSVILYAIEKFQLPSCTYIDADLYFYSNPNILIEEMGDKSILLTEHRFTKEYLDKLENGIYCVQFMTFKNNEQGLKALRWWRAACLDWCYARSEDGKFGDQKYLDDWLIKFEGVHVLQNMGGGVAPWNVQQYSFFKIQDLVEGVVNKNDENFTLVFFHFHSLKFYTNGTVWISNYPTSSSAHALIYQPYVQALIHKQKELTTILPQKDTMGMIVNDTFLLRYRWTLVLYLYWMDLKMAAKYIFGMQLKKRYEDFNLFPQEHFNKN